jgi:DnaJ-class molecular chaperone
MTRYVWRKRKCPKCLGFCTIMLTDGTLRICPTCDGKGEVEE